MRPWLIVSDIQMGLENSAMPSDTELTLHLIASGLLELYNHIERGGKLSAPYPAKLQRGLDRLATIRLHKKQTIPESMVDLLNWCRQPLLEWGLDFEVNYFGANDCLLDGNFITTLCEDWARSGTDIEASLTEEHLMNRVFELCRSSSAPGTYTALRKLWIEKPILTALEFQQKRFDLVLAPVAEILDEAYIPISSSSFTNGQIACCPICGNALQVTTHGNQKMCENERCRAKVSRKKGLSFSEKDQPVWLIRALRRFVGAPGLAEVRLAQKLESLGLTVELWPNYDAYDLRVVFPDGKKWAIDVKDWADPILLARSVKPFKMDPLWDEAFFVFPDDRKVDRPKYLQLFIKHSQVLDNRVKAKFESELVRSAKHLLKERT